VTPALFARGEVVLTRFPFTDLTGAALRPAVVVSRGQIGQDLVLAAISSVVRDTLVPADCRIESSHREFPLTGLRVTSVIRIHKLATVERSVVIRRLGRLGPDLQAQTDTLLRLVLGL
jgi:mRNA interferase MazF